MNREEDIMEMAAVADIDNLIFDGFVAAAACDVDDDAE
jgi:hypothetical protein